jgi:hypothetical protein
VSIVLAFDIATVAINIPQSALIFSKIGQGVACDPHHLVRPAVVQGAIQRRIRTLEGFMEPLFRLSVRKKMLRFSGKNPILARSQRRAVFDLFLGCDPNHGKISQPGLSSRV